LAATAAVIHFILPERRSGNAMTPVLFRYFTAFAVGSGAITTIPLPDNSYAVIVAAAISVLGLVVACIWRINHSSSKDL
jgi:hypothetical protein